MNETLKAFSSLDKMLLFILNCKKKMNEALKTIPRNAFESILKYFMEKNGHIH